MTRMTPSTQKQEVTEESGAVFKRLSIREFIDRSHTHS